MEGHFISCDRPRIVRFCHFGSIIVRGRREGPVALCTDSKPPRHGNFRPWCAYGPVPRFGSLFDKPCYVIFASGSPTTVAVHSDTANEGDANDGCVLRYNKGRRCGRMPAVPCGTTKERDAGDCVLRYKRGDRCQRGGTEMRGSDAYCGAECHGPTPRLGLYKRHLGLFSLLPAPTWKMTFRIWEVLTRLRLTGTCIWCHGILATKLTVQVKSKSKDDVVGASAFYAAYVSLVFAKNKPGNRPSRRAQRP